MRLRLRLVRLRVVRLCLVRLVPPQTTLASPLHHPLTSLELLRLRLTRAFGLRSCVRGVVWLRLGRAFAIAAFAFKRRRDAKLPTGAG